MKSDQSDSTEDLYSLSTTTVDLFDFTPSETYSSGVFVTPKISTSKFSQTLISFKSVVVGLIYFIIDIAQFAFILLRYLNLKVRRLVSFLDSSKDKVVDTLMWRRGLLFRPATHGGVIVVSALALVAGGLFSRGEIAAQDLTVQESVLRPTNTVKTIVPTNRPRSEVVAYKVAAGDTLSLVAEKYQVSTETIKWANAMGDSDALQPGQDLKIPPITGVVHQVKAGDTLASVAKAYSGDAQTIVDFPFNYIDDTLEVKPGMTLFVPNGSIPKPVVPKAPVRNNRPSTFVAGSGRLSWPVPKRINQYFSWYHQAIDLGGAYGTPIYAAASGVVIDSKKQNYSFGWYCIVDIGGGMTVAYAHMSDLACSLGQNVSRGQYIGAIGATGRATGPHLHLEVRQNGRGVDPLSLLN